MKTLPICNFILHYWLSSNFLEVIIHHYTHHNKGNSSLYDDLA
jgi:hypothetical protein